MGLAARENIFIEGEPGTAKTSFLKGVCAAWKRHCEIVIGSLRDPTDIGGLPMPGENGSYRLAAAPWAHRMAQYRDPVLVLDELPTCPPAVQAALLRVALERVVGDLVMPEETSVVAAGNPTEHSAGGWTLSAPLANRFCHVKWTLPPKEWSEGLTNGEWPAPTPPALPDDWRQRFGPTERASVAAYVDRRPQHLLVVPADEIAQGRAWPSPRTWTMAANLMAACRAVGASGEAEMLLVTGCVGEGVGTEFLAWRRQLDLRDPEELLRDPEGCRLPLDRGDRAYVILSGVAHAATSKPDEKRWHAGWKVLARAAKAGVSDVAASAARTLARNMPSGVHASPPEAAAFAPVLRAAGLLKARPGR